MAPIPTASWGFRRISSRMPADRRAIAQATSLPIPRARHTPPSASPATAGPTATQGARRCADQTHGSEDERQESRHDRDGHDRGRERGREPDDPDEPDHHRLEGEGVARTRGRDPWDPRLPVRRPAHADTPFTGPIEGPPCLVLERLPHPSWAELCPICPFGQIGPWRQAKSPRSSVEHTTKGDSMKRVLALLTVGALALAACGDDDDSSDSQSTSSREPATTDRSTASSRAVEHRGGRSGDDQGGRVDPGRDRGRRRGQVALPLHERHRHHERGARRLLAAWPPLIAEGEPVAGEGIDARPSSAPPSSRTARPGSPTTTTSCIGSPTTPRPATSPVRESAACGTWSRPRATASAERGSRRLAGSVRGRNPATAERSQSCANLRS